MLAKGIGCGRKQQRSSAYASPSRWIGLGGERGARGVVAMVVLIGIGACLAMPLRRDAEYSRVIADFKSATALPQMPLDRSNSLGWIADFEGANGVGVHLRAGAHLTDARLQYSDEQSPRPVFNYKDYTNIIDIRVRGRLLYVLRAISLFRTDYRLTVYDLNGRMVVTDRRVDITDAN
jgi:hypothetical protein